MAEGASGRVGDDGRAAEDGDRAAVIGDRDGVGVGAFFGVGVSGADGEDHAVGRADGGEVGGGQGLRGGAVTPVDHGRAAAPVVKSATVAPWLASVKVPSRTVPVVIPSMPVISVPLELVSWASRTVRRARRAGQRGGHTAQGGDVDADRVRRPFLGVRVAAEDLEDRVARLAGVDADLADRQRDRSAVGVPSPQPPGGRVACTLATVARVLGSMKVASTIVPVSWPSTPVKLLTAPVTGMIGDRWTAGR